MSKKRKPSRKQKPSFKAPASPNVASANKPSEKTQPSLKTPNVTRGSESQPPSPPSPSLAKPPTPPLLSETGRSARARAMPYTTEQFVRVLWANSFAGPRTASFGARRASLSSRWRR